VDSTGGAVPKTKTTKTRRGIRKKIKKNIHQNGG